MKTIGLCMIVKNEAHVILRCLDSVRPLIDYALIEDTGSTDGTQDVIRNWLDRENLPGEVFDAPWQDFAHNRSLALARLRERPDIDYALIIDADDVLVCEHGFDAAAFKGGLAADFYNLTLRADPVTHYRAMLCSNRHEFRFRGVLHEFLAPPEGCSSALADGIHVIERREGARSRDPDKYRKDAAVLEQALQSEDDAFMRSRYTFYLAQSWKDCGENEKALSAYLDRAGLGFWDEEVAVSLHNAAQLMERLDHPGHEIIGMYLRAYEACPRRAEPLHAAARYCRQAGKHHQGHMLAKQGLAIAQPASGLFIEPWIYDYGLLDELAVNAYWVARYQECLDACERLLNERKMPADMRERVEANARFAREKLAPAPAAVSALAEEPARSVPLRHRPRPPASEPPRTAIFIHASWRTASTWFWNKFRQQPGTLCFFEPFNELYTSFTREQAANWDWRTWDSRHPAGDPYCAEYFPVIRRSGGMRLFHSAIPFEWYIPEEGVHGGLRAEERRYLGLLLRQAWRQGAAPVLGFTRSLGRISAIRQAFGGVHIFQHRNLWRQWASYLSMKRQGEAFFYDTLFNIVGRSGGEFVEYLRDQYLPPDASRRAAQETVDALRTSLTEEQAFELFVALHAYLQAHAECAADIVVDVSRLARDETYRARISGEIADRTGFSVSLDDIRAEASDRSGFRREVVDWDRVAGHAAVAARMLGAIADPEQMRQRTAELVATVQSEMAADATPRSAIADTESRWTPPAPAGGTNLMEARLRERLGAELDRINLRINHPGHEPDARPRVVWVHHDIDQQYMQWCRDEALVRSVDRFVFVSDWQRQRYVAEFGIPAERSLVLRNATDVDPVRRVWQPGPVWRCGFASTPFRGLSVLLDAWEMLKPANAELHLWSSMKLYLHDDGPYRHLYERAKSLPGVIYHSVVPNEELRRALRDIDFFTYPSTFAETSCLAAIEAMAAGCRLIVPEFGALPETTAGFARTYSWTPDPKAHAETFAQLLAEEMRLPWGGTLELSTAQQDHCATTYDWPPRLTEWRTLIASLSERTVAAIQEPISSEDSQDRNEPGAQSLSFNICRVTFNEHRVFENTIRVLHDVLCDLGHTCTITENKLEGGAVNIVVGAVVWRAKNASLEFLKNSPYILYQFEQLLEDAGLLQQIPEYVEILRNSSVIFDYSPSNMEYLKKMGLGKKAIYLPLSFHRSLELFSPSGRPDIDVLFVGGYSDRRSRIINQLQAAGAHAVHAFNVYGDDLLGLMQRAKIILNVHSADRLNVLETHRISFALANGCFVISEIADHDPYGGTVVFAEYDALVSTCLEYLGPKDAERSVAATAAHEKFRDRHFLDDMKSAISNLPIDDLMSTQGCDNMDEQSAAMDNACLGYLYNNGGLNYQKMTLLGLFLRAWRQGTRRVMLPDWYSLDTVSSNSAPVPFADVMRIEPLRDFAARYGIEIIDGPPRGEPGGWDYAADAHHYVSHAGLLNELTADSFACDFFRSLVPTASASRLTARLADLAFRERGIRVAVQLRIEKEWAPHAARWFTPEVGTTEDNVLSHGEIIRKIRDTAIDIGSQIYVVCDEPGLPVPKAQIRDEIRDEFGVELIWKSDLLPAEELAQLSPLQLSMLDFEMCVAAESFVGLSRSSFSNMVALEKYARRRAPVERHYIYNVAGPSLASRHDNGAFAVAQLAAATDPWATMHSFHRAHVFQSSGEPERALEAYSANAAWAEAHREEAYLSLYRAAQIKEQLGCAAAAVIDTYRRAAEALPSRSEARHGASRHARNAGMFKEGYDIAKPGLDLTAPTDGRFVEHWIYEWALLDEYAVNAYWVGRFDECLAACERLLREGKMPEHMRERVTLNANLARERLSEVTASQSVFERQLETPTLLQQLKINMQKAPEYSEEDSVDATPATQPVRLIAYYLPQYHPIPENDAAWGKGFTEWNNVAKSLPRFIDHYQPHLPGELGFYDLRNPDILRRQAELARQYGNIGFCIHYYWFNGRSILNKPLQSIMENPDIDIPFCINWANENWTRHWNGGDRDIILEQKYSTEDDLAFAQAIETFMRDKRYIRINGRPLLLLYRPRLLPDAAATVERWRTHLKNAGVGDPYVVMCDDTFGSEHPHKYGMDAVAGFPPHRLGWSTPDINSNLCKLDPEFEGPVKSYEAMVEAACTLPKQDYVYFHGVCPSWDNTARQPKSGTVFAGALPQSYGRWLDRACRRTLAERGGDERIVFINAWNEWGEGAHLEPDCHYGYAYLKETRQALDDLVNTANKNVATITAMLDIGDELEWEPDRLVPHPHWVGHIPFAFWVVKALRPRMVVELGTHRGNSYCAFLQAITNLQLDCKCFAVDNWTGDVHMSVEPEVLKDLRKFHDPRFGRFSTLLPMNFDDARKIFDNKMIDLLHIDGTHTYDAVRHDFEQWESTISEKGVVIFHDTNERQTNFGVWRLWEELSARFPAFEFHHSHGLGVLGVGRNLPNAVQALFDASRKSNVSEYVRQIFAQRGTVLRDRF